MKLTLRRKQYQKGFTHGTLFKEGQKRPLCFTLENEWLDNQIGISCIPTGTYSLSSKDYGRFYERYFMPIPILGGTEPRTEILIHPGNTADDTRGCVLVGDTRYHDSIGNSKDTWLKLHTTFMCATEIEIIEPREDGRDWYWDIDKYIKCKLI